MFQCWLLKRGRVRKCSIQFIKSYSAAREYMNISKLVTNVTILVI